MHGLMWCGIHVKYFATSFPVRWFCVTWHPCQARNTGNKQKQTGLGVGEKQRFPFFSSQYLICGVYCSVEEDDLPAISAITLVKPNLEHPDFKEKATN